MWFFSRFLGFLGFSSRFFSRFFKDFWDFFWNFWDFLRFLRFFLICLKSPWKMWLRISIRIVKDWAFTCSCQIKKSFIRSEFLAGFPWCQQCFNLYNFSIVKRSKLAQLTKWRRSPRNYTNYNLLKLISRTSFERLQ